MSWTIILGVIWKIIEARTEAGWPWLIKFFERWWKKVESDVTKITVGVAMGVAAAPPELLAMIIDMLTNLKDSAGLFMKPVYALLIKIVPSFIDKIWDKLFEAGHVAASFASFPAMVQAGPVLSVDEMIEAVDCET